jgi:hypothetical protein
MCYDIDIDLKMEWLHRGSGVEMLLTAYLTERLSLGGVCVNVQ